MLIPVPVRMSDGGAGAPTTGGGSDVLSVLNHSRYEPSGSENGVNVYPTSLSVNRDSDRFVASLLLCWRPNFSRNPFLGSNSAAIPVPLLPSPSIWLLTRASLRNCVLSSFENAFLSRSEERRVGKEWRYR